MLLVLGAALQKCGSQQYLALLLEDPLVQDFSCVAMIFGMWISHIFFCEAICSKFKPSDGACFS